MPCEYEYMLEHGDGRTDMIIREETKLRMKIREEVEDASTL